jgi:hypothetical protein
MVDLFPVLPGGISPQIRNDSFLDWGRRTGRAKWLMSDACGKSMVVSGGLVVNWRLLAMACW